MNEELLNQNLENQPKRKIENKQDVQAIQAELLEKIKQIIDKAPKLYFDVKNAPYYLNILFDQEGNPKGDFRVSDKYKKKVALAFKHPKHQSSTGKTYWGNLVYPGFGKVEYIIIANPTFLTDEELDELKRHHRLIKRINNVDIELVPPTLRADNYSDNIEKYMKTIKEPRKKIQEIKGLLSELENLKAKLPMGPREVIIEQPENPQDYPRK